MAQVQESARKASIGAEIEAMPMKYNTLVTDTGSSFSGQKQRIPGGLDNGNCTYYRGASPGDDPVPGFSCPQVFGSGTSAAEADLLQSCRKYGKQRRLLAPQARGPQDARFSRIGVEARRARSGAVVDSGFAG
jgi:hypothetical protein